MRAPQFPTILNARLYEIVESVISILCRQREFLKSSCKEFYVNIKLRAGALRDLFVFYSLNQKGNASHTQD